MNDWDFKDLRTKLDVMGFNQTLPVLAIPLVGAIFGDLIKTTECLRDTKRQVADLLEEKACWELGVEPYKCDNSRLLAECNELHLQSLKEREGYELRLYEAERRIRNLQTDNEHLQSHNVQLQSQLDAFLSKQLINAATAKRTQLAISRQNKRPFISTVRSGEALPALSGISTNSSLKCTKCNAGVFQKTTTTTKDGVTVTHTSGAEEIDRLQNELTSAGEQLEFYKRKVESRNREIRRLNDLLAGGRPPAALAKDCCYKEVGALSQDIDMLQRENSELMAQVGEYQDKMHDAMQRALRIEEEKQKLHTQLYELKEAALQVEQQANSEIDAKELELRQLQTELKQFHRRNDQRTKNPRLAAGCDESSVHNDKRILNEKLNLLTRREEELEALNEKHKKKLLKMEAKMSTLQKELREQQQQSCVTLDEEKIRLKSERDFFQKEYLRLMSKSGSDSEVAFLQAQIKSKDDELHALRSELCQASVAKLQMSPRKGDHCDSLPPPTTTCSSNSNSNRSDCVQAAIGRVERERDCARIELERLRCERDTLREKQLSSVQLHAEELQALRLRNEDLQDRIRQLERDYRDLNTARVPTETHNALLKEDMAELNKRLATLQAENEHLRRENGQITLINDQNERIISDYQSKLLLAERQLHKADVRASTLDSSRETNRNEVTQLRTEIGSLRQTYIALEHEKDMLLNQLDNKTERLYKLEYEHKDCKEKRHALEQTIKELESQVDKLNTRTRQRDSALNETSAESKTLRQQIVALKASRDEAIAENGRLTDKLSDAQMESKTLQKKLKDSEQQVANMKQQLHKYVQEVKRAEDLLMNKVYFVLKEKEREELLEHYHNLTHDQVVLEGNNQSLEFEATEFKRQICELECEVRSLKDQLCCRQCKIDDLEMQLTAARASMRCLERELENAREQKIELDVRKELCDKLDIEKDKLNAELNELNEVRRKLEKECEKLRSELQEKFALNQVTTETTEQMLERIRGDQQRQDEAELSAKREMERLRQLHEKTVRELQEERERCNQQELLANQYERQAQELRKNLTEDRFCQARSREVSPKVPPKTL
ncbi:centrosomal protein of 135 kDa isoform X1 [Drosophila novamexicana]|uniref:centrosomal protein of 135 kDa isoform X1 n=1 Tax=Drosophila novamexicana TaxID=47314 RepID=UPI0011E5D51B|nr:centrosomal protein of 135 kDa isoform X1 [Drosophila novamexicana]